jgi:hypothetical protein
MELNHVESYKLEKFEDVIEHMRKKRVIYLRNEESGDNVRVANLGDFMVELERGIVSRKVKVGMSKKFVDCLNQMAAFVKDKGINTKQSLIQFK